MDHVDGWNEQCLLTENVPYQAAEKIGLTSTHSVEGMLQNGRVVWRNPSEEPSEGRIRIFAEGIGLLRYLQLLSKPLNAGKPWN